MELLLTPIAECIYYGFMVATFIIVAFRKHLSSLSLQTAILIAANNFLALIRSVIIAFTLLYGLAADWYSQTAFSQYALVNRVTGPFWIFFWIPFLIELAVFIILFSHRRRHSLKYSLIIVCLWLATILFSLIPLDVFAPQTGWHFIIYQLIPYLGITVKVLLYFLLLTIAYLVSLKKKVDAASMNN